MATVWIEENGFKYRDPLNTWHYHAFKAMGYHLDSGKRHANARWSGGIGALRVETFLQVKKYQFVIILTGN
jgi:hypothetical protein